MLKWLSDEDRRKDGVGPLVHQLVSAKDSAAFPKSASLLNARFASLGCSDLRFTFEDLVSIYRQELQQGKYWGVAADLAALGEPLEVQVSQVNFFNFFFILVFLYFYLYLKRH